MSDIPATPELDKMTKAREEGGSAHIGAFLEWAESNSYQLMKETITETKDFWGNIIEDTVYIPAVTEHVLAEYFGVDLAKADQERRAVRDAYIAANEQHRTTYTVHPAPEEDTAS
jgi:hypothetical protein